MLRALAAALIIGFIATSFPALAQSLQHEKYQLDNGLTVILHEDHSVPVGTINIWYRVGAQNEPPGRSGFAHLYEHLMFMGTRRVPDNQFDVIMENAGGSNNASTSLDRTNYFSVGPASLIPTLLWLEADRLEDMGPTMTQEKLDRQRDVVRNEIRQNVENTPYGRAFEQAYRFMYPKDHPYHNAVYGTHEDLEAATVNDVKDFFATFYVPSNASLVVAGDFDPEQIKPLIQDLFGDLPAGAAPEKRPVLLPELDREIRWTMLDKVQLPLLTFVYHSPAAYADGDAEMRLIADLLTDGPSSRLYRRLILEDQSAVQVAAFQDSAQLSSLFWILVYAKPGADLAAIERAVDLEVGGLAAAGPTPEELSQRQSAIEMALLSSLQSIRDRADKLNEYEFYYGNPDSLQRDLDRFRNATPQSVRAWASQVLNPGARLVQTVLPEQPQRHASARDTRPADLTPAAFTPPEPERFSLSNGVNVLLWRRPALPIVSVAALLAAEQPVDAPEQAGRTALLASMLSEGTQRLTNVEFAQAVQALGGSFHAAGEHDSLTAGLSVLARNFDAGVGLLAEALLTPRMDPDDWERVKTLHVEELLQEDEEPAVVAGRVALRTLLSPSNPFGLPAPGTPETVGRLSLDDIQTAHRALVRPDAATILIAGDVTAEQARAALEKHLASWSAQGSVALGPADTSVRPRQRMDLYIVDRPGAVQTVITFAAPAPAIADQRRVPLRLLNTILGGSFTSRLNQNLREKHGFTYGARSRYTLGRHLGWFSASAAVQSEVTGAALREFIAELNRIRAGDITPDETAKARETVRNDVVSAYGTLDGTIALAASRLAEGLPLSTIAADLTAGAALSAADLNALAGRAIPLDGGVLVLVGDKNTILEQIKDLNLPQPTFVDARGNPAESN